MATNIELILEGLRGAAKAAGSYSDRHQRAEEGRSIARSKEEAAAEAKRRLEAAGISRDEIQKAMDEDPEFDSAKLAKATAPFEKITGGDPTLDNMLKDIRGAIDSREKNKRATAQATGAAVRESKRDARAASAEARAGRQEVGTLSKDFGNEDVTTATVKVRQAYNRIKAATEGKPNGIKDIGAITAYMKSIDEGSTVREGEFKTAAEARSFWANNTSTDADGNLTTKNGIPLPSFIAAAIQKFDASKGGAILLPEQRQNLLGAAENSYREQLAQQKVVDQKYLKRVTDAGISDRGLVIDRLADEDLAELDAEKEARASAAAAKKKEQGLTIKPEGAPAQPSAKVMDEATFQQFFEDNKAIVTAALEAAAKRLGRPLSPEEKKKQIDALVKAHNVQTAPGRK